jgi:hypothetical protein
MNTATILTLPHRGEFGQLLMTYVRWVHGIQAERKIVCCRQGDEPLFPTATEFFYEWEMPPDIHRNTRYLMGAENTAYLEWLANKLVTRYPGASIRYPLDGKKPQRFPWCPEYNFVPKPACAAPGVSPEILVAPRFRQHGAHRNYQHWHEVIDGLETAGYTVGLLGVQETSVDRPGLAPERKAWNYPDDLGVTLHWMQKAKLVLCTDSGIAHLAVLAGAPLQVIYGKEGVEAGKEEWRWAFDHMRAHSIAKCQPILGGWDDPMIVVAHVLAETALPGRSSCSRPLSRYAVAHGNSAVSD